jgi:hypothetical protein
MVSRVPNRLGVEVMISSISRSAKLTNFRVADVDVIKIIDGSDAEGVPHLRAGSSLSLNISEDVITEKNLRSGSLIRCRLRMGADDYFVIPDSVEVIN